LGLRWPGDGLVPGSSSFPCVLRNVSEMSPQCLRNVSAISLLPIRIFLLLSGASSIGPVGECAAVSSRIDVSVPAVGYRAFVFAASRHFVAGNRSTECRGAVSVGVSLLARGDASEILTVTSRECLVSDVR